MEARNARLEPSGSEWMEVGGVVGEVKVNGVRQDALPQIYIPTGRTTTVDTTCSSRPGSTRWTWLKP